MHSFQQTEPRKGKRTRRRTASDRRFHGLSGDHGIVSTVSTNERSRGNFNPTSANHSYGLKSSAPINTAAKNVVLSLSEVIGNHRTLMPIKEPGLNLNSETHRMGARDP